MQQMVSLLHILLLAQNVSGNIMPVIRSSKVLYSGCCLWYLVLWFSSCRSGVELWVVFPQTGHTTHLKTKAPNTTGSNHLYITLGLLMMGIIVTEIC